MHDRSPGFEASQRMPGSLSGQLVLRRRKVVDWTKLVLQGSELVTVGIRDQNRIIVDCAFERIQGYIYICLPGVTTRFNIYER